MNPLPPLWRGHHFSPFDYHRTQRTRSALTAVHRQIFACEVVQSAVEWGWLHVTLARVLAIVDRRCVVHFDSAPMPIEILSGPALCAILCTDHAVVWRIQTIFLCSEIFERIFLE